MKVNGKIGMALADCKHTEEKEFGTRDGKTLVACTTCGQTRRYIAGDEFSIVITKLGRIDGAIVMPPVATRLSITPEESRLVREGWDIINAPSKPLRHVVELEPDIVEEKGDKNKLYFDKPREEILSDKKVTKPPAPKPDPAAVIEQPVMKEVTKVPSESTESVLKPANWPQMLLAQKKKWHDERKQEILTDLATIGSFATRRKWGLTHSTLGGLLKRWGEPPLVRTRRGKPAPKETNGPVISKNVQELLPIPMPIFPTFDKEWRPEVQIEWLKAYTEIVNTVYLE